MASARSLPVFCRSRQARRDSAHDLYNAEAIDDGRMGACPIPAGSLLFLSREGELLELLPSAPVTVEGLAFAAGSRVGFVGGRPLRGTLVDDRVFAATPCRAGAEVQVLPVEGAWYALEGELARDATLDGFEAMAGTRFLRREVGELVAFTPCRDVVIDGVPCRGGEQVRRDRGRLSVATLAKDHVIDGVPCAAGGAVHFNVGGLSHAALSRAWTARGATWRPGTLVSGTLSEGRVSDGTLEAEAEIEGFPVAAGSRVRRDLERRLADFVLAHDAVVDGYPCRGGTRVRRGGLREYTLAAPKVLRGFRLDPGDVLTIDDHDDYDAGVPQVRLATGREVFGREVPAGSTVHLEGWLFRRMSVCLGAPATIDAVVYPARTWLRFSRGGRLERVFEPATPPAPRAE